MTVLGIHVINPTPAALLQVSLLPCVCALDDLTALRVAQPDALRVYRRYFPYQDVRADPVSLAHQIDDALGGYRHPRLYVQTLVGISKDVTPLYINLTVQVTPLLHEAGLKVAGPSQYSGDFDAASWGAWRAAGWAGLDLCTVQGYWASRGLTRWNALRYREYWRPGDPPVFIGECGRDRVRDGEHGEYIGSPGWKSQGVSGAEYVAELFAYDLELQCDPFVWGGAIFTAGALDGEWQDFDTDGLNLAVLAAPPFDSGGDDPMRLSEQYPAQFAEWVAAGGDPDGDFRAHLIGTGTLPGTEAELARLKDRRAGTEQQIENLARKLGPLA